MGGGDQVEISKGRVWGITANGKSTQNEVIMALKSYCSEEIGF